MPVGLKANGTLKKGYKYKKGGAVVLAKTATKKAAPKRKVGKRKATKKK